MMVYCAARFKPKRKKKTKGVIAKKYNRSSAILGVEELPSLSYGPRVGADAARKIKSLHTNSSFTGRKESMKYDGERKLLGIAVLHKSCLQPVFSQKEAEEISKMRRG
jgi:hypothetical protein